MSLTPAGCQKQSKSGNYRKCQKVRLTRENTGFNALSALFANQFVVCRAIRYTCRASASTRNRTWIWTFGGAYAILCTIETFSVPTWSRTRSRALGVPCAIRYTIGTDTLEPTTGFAPAWSGLQDRRLSQSSHVGNKQECKDLNPVGRLWRPLPLPGGRSCSHHAPRDGSSRRSVRSTFNLAASRSSTLR